MGRKGQKALGKQEGRVGSEVSWVGMNSHRGGSCWAHLSVTHPESLLNVRVAKDWGTDRAEWSLCKKELKG